MRPFRAYCIVFLCLILGLGTALTGQNWKWQHRVPQSNHLNGLSMVDSIRGWAVGKSGIIIKTEDGGTSWTVQHSPTTKDLADVHFIDAESGWAVGDSGTILHTMNGGARWELQESGTTNHLNSVCFSDTHHGYAVGSYGKILEFKASSERWTTRDSITDKHLNAIKLLNDSLAWAVGWQGALLAIRPDDVQALAPPPDYQSTTFYNLLPQSTDSVWLVGWKQQILFTPNGGVDWFLKHEDPDSYHSFLDICLAPDGTGWAIGQSGLGFRTVDHGNSWDFVSVGAHLAAVECHAGGKGIAVGTINIWKIDGESWTNQVKGPSSDLRGMHFINYEQGWAVGKFGTLLKTVDGGASWEERNTHTGRELESVFFINENRGWAVGKTGTLIKTESGGDDWSSIELGTTEWLKSVFFVDDSTGWAVGGRGTILKTSDSGTSWMPQEAGTTRRLESVYFIDSLVGWVTASSGGIVLKTVDGGQRWDTLRAGTSEQFHDIHFINQQTGWLVGYNGIILHSVDGGHTWTPQASHVTRRLQHIHFTDAKHGMAVGRDGTLLLTSDGGLNWERDLVNVSGDLHHVEMLDPNTAWVAGNGGTILRFVGCLNEATSRRQDSLTLVAIYRSTSGENWQRQWDFSRPIYEWEGVSVNEAGLVTAVVLEDNNLQGLFPSIFCSFGALQSLDLSGNQLGGEIPISISTLSQLQFLDLSSNALEGDIPAELSKLTALHTLDLSNNQLTGFIPDWITHWQALENLSLASNALEGHIPEALTELSALTHLDLSRNRLVGPVPVDLNKLQQLTLLYLEENALTALPTFTISALSDLRTSNNFFTFEDLLPNLAYFQEPEQYAPQRPLEALQYSFLPCDTSFFIWNTVDTSIEERELQWTKAGTTFEGARTDSLDLEQQLGHEFNAYEGQYDYTMTHSKLPSLRLEGSVFVDLERLVNATVVKHLTVCLDDMDAPIQNPDRTCDLLVDQADTTVILERQITFTSYTWPEAITRTDVLKWGQSIMVCGRRVDCSHHGTILICTNPLTNCPEVEHHINFQCPDTAGIPAAISPNDDGDNDFLVIPALITDPENYKNNQLDIYNRFRQLVWSGTNLRHDGDQLWKGNDQSGTALPAGTYYYVFSHPNGVERGNVTIIRSE